MFISATIRDAIHSEQLDKPSAWRTNMHLASVLVVYVVIFGLASYAAVDAVWLIAWIAMAFMLSGFGAMMHEAVHGNLYRSKLANRIAGIAAAGAILVCWSSYRAYHLQHHSALRTVDDPERKPTFTKRWQYPVILLGGPMFVGRLLWFALSTIFRRPPKFVRTAELRRSIKNECMILVIAYGVVFSILAAYPFTIAKLWLIPVAFTYLLVLPMLLFPEHFQGQPHVPVHQNTRTVVSNAALRWAFWNANLHTAHHLAPAVPFHALPRLHKMIAPDIAWLESSYLGFHFKAMRSIGRIDQAGFALDRTNSYAAESRPPYERPGECGTASDASRWQVVAPSETPVAEIKPTSFAMSAPRLLRAVAAASRSTSTASNTVANAPRAVESGTRPSQRPKAG